MKLYAESKVESLLFLKKKNHLKTFKYLEAKKNTDQHFREYHGRS